MENTYQKDGEMLVVTTPQTPIVETFTLKQIDDAIAAYSEALANSTAQMAIWNARKAKAVQLQVEEPAVIEDSSQ